MGISKALVVDDSRLARVALSKMLARRGLEVDTAECGGDAVEYLRSGSADVVFIDYMMPDMDGFQAAEAINLMRGERALPLVMYTSQDSDEDRRRAHELGICGFLAKPTSDHGLDEVLDHVSRWRPPEPSAAAAVVPDVVGEEASEQPDPIAAPAPACSGAVAVPRAAAEPGTAPGGSVMPAASSVDPVPERTGDCSGDPSSSPTPVSSPATLDREDVRKLVAELGDALEKRADSALETMEQRWQERLTQASDHWREGLTGFGESLHEASTEAAALAGQQAAERLAAETERSLMERIARLEETLPAAEPLDREALVDELRQELATDTRYLAEETALAAAQRQAEAVAEGIAREVSGQQAADSAARAVEEALAGFSGEREGEDIEALAADAVAAAVGELARTPGFQAQVLSVLGEHGIPRLKNQLDHWVEQRARAVVDDLVAEHLETTVDAMVQQAVAASAEAAVREADVLHARYRRHVILVGGALGVGVVAAAGLALL